VFEIVLVAISLLCQILLQELSHTQQLQAINLNNTKEEILKLHQLITTHSLSILDISQTPWPTTPQLHQYLHNITTIEPIPTDTSGLWTPQRRHIRCSRPEKISGLDKTNNLLFI
jgi:hypothetical protein